MTEQLQYQNGFHNHFSSEALQMHCQLGKTHRKSVLTAYMLNNSLVPPSLRLGIKTFVAGFIAFALQLFRARISHWKITTYTRPR